MVQSVYTLKFIEKIDSCFLLNSMKRRRSTRIAAYTKKAKYNPAIELPEEIWKHIFNQTDCTELVRVRLVCKNFNNLIIKEYTLIKANMMFVYGNTEDATIYDCYIIGFVDKMILQNGPWKISFDPDIKIKIANVHHISIKMYAYPNESKKLIFWYGTTWRKGTMYINTGKYNKTFEVDMDISNYLLNSIKIYK